MHVLVCVLKRTRIKIRKKKTGEKSNGNRYLREKELHATVHTRISSLQVVRVAAVNVVHLSVL